MIFLFGLNTIFQYFHSFSFVFCLFLFIFIKCGVLFYNVLSFFLHVFCFYYKFLFYFIVSFLKGRMSASISIYFALKQFLRLNKVFSMVKTSVPCVACRGAFINDFTFFQCCHHNSTITRKIWSLGSQMYGSAIQWRIIIRTIDKSGLCPVRWKFVTLSVDKQHSFSVNIFH